MQAGVRKYSRLFCFKEDTMTTTNKTRLVKAVTVLLIIVLTVIYMRC